MDKMAIFIGRFLKMMEMAILNFSQKMMEVMWEMPVIV